MQETSNMIIVPVNDEDVSNPNVFMENLKKSNDIEIQNVEWNENYGVMINLSIKSVDYIVYVSPSKLEIPDFIRPGHFFSEEEFQMIASKEYGLSVCIDFDDNPARCYYDQLKIVDAMIPDKLAVMDCAAEKLISGKWVSFAAKSDTYPAPHYMFTVQAVGDENGEVWLHTHGLKRCGMYELEILNSDKENYNTHYHIIDSMACHMLESDKPIEPGDEVFLAQISENNYMVATAVNWEEALPYYPNVSLGGKDDRDDFHSEDTYVVMLYLSPNDKEERKYTPVQYYNKELADNPMFMVSTKETLRMKKLARERLDYMVKGFKKEDCTLLVKIGLVPDEQFWGNKEEDDCREHIWFEANEINGDTITATLTQEPYYVSGIKEGDQGTYPFDDITDWILFMNGMRITPDDIYLI